MLVLLLLHVLLLQLLQRELKRGGGFFVFVLQHFRVLLRSS